jgi:glycosyl transferase, family 25
MRQEFDRVGVEFERIAAVDGAALPPSVVEDFWQNRAATKPDGWLPGEIGCFLSHLEAWRRIAAHDGPWGAVFEDDIRVSPDLTSLLASADWIPPDADIVRLEAYRSMRLTGGRQIADLWDRKLYRALSGTSGAAGYLIAQRTARWLTETPPALHTSADVFLFKPKASPVAKKLRRYQVVPALCIQEGVLAGHDTHLGSQIKTRNTRGRGYRERSNPILKLWPIMRRAVPFRP